jgi:hypothetical protein
MDVRNCKGGAGAESKAAGKDKGTGNAKGNRQVKPPDTEVVSAEVGLALAERQNDRLATQQKYNLADRKNRRNNLGER